MFYGSFEDKHDILIAWKQTGSYTPPHFHHAIELICCLEGELSVTTDKEYTMTPGDVLLVPSLAVHGTGQSASSRIIVVEVTHTYIPECRWLLSASRITPQPIKDENGALGRLFVSAYEIIKTRGIYEGMFKSDEEKFTESRLVITALVNAMLLQYRRLGLTSADDEAAIPRTSSTVVDAISYIQLHYREKLLLTDISRALFCNSQQLSEKFREMMHISITDYITSLRTVEAYHLLMMHPDLTLTKIAERSGFQSMRSMLRAFRARYGCTPSDMKHGK